MKKKRIVRVLLIGSGVVVAVGILLAVLFLSALDSGIDTLKDILGSNIQQAKDRDALYQSIADDMAESEPLLAETTQVGFSYGWGAETPDRSNQYFFFLPDALYGDFPESLHADYRSYWLDNVGPSAYYEGLNRDLGESGDYVFSAVNVSELSYLSDVDYAGVPLAANETYYLVTLYKRAIYYRCVLRYEDEEHYTILTDFRCDENSRAGRYLYHWENEAWVKEALSE